MSRKKNSKLQKSFGMGSRIRAYRKSKNLKQKEFATVIGIPQSTLSAIENEVSLPRVDFLAAIIQKTDISPEELMSFFIGKLYKIEPPKIMTIYQHKPMIEEKSLDLIKMAQYILQSKTDCAVALTANIQAFYDRLKKEAEFEKRLVDLEEQVMDTKSGLVKRPPKR